ncbi:unnamed protein product [Fraxinus pennsylvanica]|uniref:RING-type domain-containing protein n=1 Tax=Fraxinus pennsylvanica TaxID=56036 RepID=A0AAD1Z4F0_9LAMI|nr:unnamed protein product [Fraxinus pennsylvanica]
MIPSTVWKGVTTYSSVGSGCWRMPKWTRLGPAWRMGEDEEANKFFDCAISLAEFAAGKEVCVLPRCGHGFHVGCVDTWLGSHSSCLSYRRLRPSAGVRNEEICRSPPLHPPQQPTIELNLSQHPNQ